MFATILAAFTLLGDYTEDYAWFPESASSFAAENDWLYKWITYICIGFFVPIAYALFYFAIRYHKAKGEKAESNVAHNTPLELAWSILPSFFLVWMFIAGARGFLEIRTVPDGANEINVQAFKWGWTMDYGGGTLYPELHILVDEPTKLSMRSSDVIHSLYIPAFRAKKDIVPGRYNYMWFKPTVANEMVSEKKVADAEEWQESPEGKAWSMETGLSWNYDKHQFTPDGYKFYDLYCAEYCGKNHSEMQTAVVVHKTLDDLDAWIKKYSSRPEGELPAVYGEKLYERRGCTGCHSLDGSKRVGPSFNQTYGNKRDFVAGASLTADENYIRESIVYPKAKVVAGYPPVMPSYKGQLSDDDLHCLVEFLKTKSAVAASPAADATPATEATPK